MRLTTNIHLTLMMTSPQVVETPFTTTDDSLSQDYIHPDFKTTLSNLFCVVMLCAMDMFLLIDKTVVLCLVLIKLS